METRLLKLEHIFSASLDRELLDAILFLRDQSSAGLHVLNFSTPLSSFL